MNRSHFQPDLFLLLDAANNDALDDKQWLAVLKEAVISYNALSGTNYDPDLAVKVWISDRK